MKTDKDFLNELNNNSIPQQPRQIILTETKHNSKGYFPKGSVLFLGDWNDEKNGFDVKDAEGNICLVGVNSGFNFLHEVAQTSAGAGAIPLAEQYRAGLFNMPIKNDIGGGPYQPCMIDNHAMNIAFHHLNNQVQLCINNIKKPHFRTIDFNTPQSLVSKDEKIMFVQEFIKFLQSSPY